MSLMYENNEDGKKRTNAPHGHLPPNLNPNGKPKFNNTGQTKNPTLNATSNENSQKNNTPISNLSNPTNGQSTMSNSPGNTSSAINNTTSTTANSTGTAISSSGSIASERATTAVAGTTGGPAGLVVAGIFSQLKKIRAQNNNNQIGSMNTSINIIIVVVAIPLLLCLLISTLMFLLLPGVVSSLYLGQYETSNVSIENDYESEELEDTNNIYELISKILDGIKNNSIKIVNNFSRAFYDDADIIGYKDIAELQEFKTTDEFRDSYEANMKLLDEAMNQSYEYQKKQFIQWCDDNDFDSEYALKSFPTIDSIEEIDYLTFLACTAQSEEYNLNNYVSKNFKTFLLSEEAYPYLLTMEINNVTLVEDEDNNTSEKEEKEDNENNEDNEDNEEQTTNSNKQGDTSLDTPLSKNNKIQCEVTLTPFDESSLATLYGYSMDDSHYSTGINYKTSILETKLMIQATCGDLFSDHVISNSGQDYPNTSDEESEIIDLKDYKINVLNDIEKGYYTAEDYAYMVAVMSAEGNHSYDSAVAVGYCVMYRCKVNNQSVKQIVTAPSQFCSPWAKYIGKPINQICATAAVAVLKSEAPNNVGDCYFFFSASAVTCTRPGAYYKEIGGNLYYKKWGDVHTIHTDKHDCVKYKH